GAGKSEGHGARRFSPSRPGASTHRSGPRRGDRPVIQLHRLGYRIGERVLFEDLDWGLAPGDRVALVGPNGAGKAHLIRGRPAEPGPRVLARGTRLGHLPQEAAERYDGTVLARAMEAHRHLLAMREELDALHARLQGIGEDDPELVPVLERAGELQHHLELHD